MTARKNNDDLAESRRILGQIEQEAGYARRLKNHLNAADADQDDRIETWGTRIGRTIGFLVTIAVILLFIRYMISN
ncbi:MULTISPECIES: hypothetical protein [Mesorhizobium]|uniref:Uncharacterized protein n=1 Tax=Mesorhizobium denitrificans TaxID=2294114 RepID=A0A371XH50_9HYPH|nr:MULTISPECIES: hypothetical protein [Mesorhizobium]RFC68548.1 hypothetical protein DY251_06145 [Mesorhizobium denitrificans]